MNRTIIKQFVSKQLKESEIKESEIDILETDWGYAVQVSNRNNWEYLNELFDKEGHILYPLGTFHHDSGEIYSTEMKEFVDNYEKKYTFPYAPKVRWKQLDINHFVIPRINEKEIGNALFFVDESNQVTYKGFITGRICGNILTENKKMIEQKLLLVCEEIDKVKDEYEYYYYSWDKNKRISDKWNQLYSPEDIYRIKDFLYNKMNNMPKDFVNEVLRYMQEKEAWLAVLSIISNDNQHQRHFISFIGMNGLPLIDLTYITSTNEVKTHSLKKEEIGEVDEIRQWLKKEMEQRLLEIEENKKNIATNFFQITGITINNEKDITDKKGKMKKKKL